MSIIGEMENEHLVIVITVEDKLNIGSTSELQNKHTIFGKVVMKTTVGDVELELWAKETAKAYRNFIQLSMDGYWDDTLFHRIIKGFITQDGDPTGTGEGGKIYGEPFKDDFHTRLRSCRRDLIAVANAGKMTMVSNTSLFLILHQICRINIQSLVELLVNLYINDKPLYPPRLIKPIILNNPFSDIIPRIIVQECEEVKDSSETQTAGVTMKTTVGDIELKLWAKETPKTCRNFIQLCVEGYYHDLIFHTQGGDPSDTGEDGKIYGKPFKVTMKTTVGDIELKLWAKETPKTCRNFIQLCVEGYYHDLIFHTQGGDPSDTGEDGQILYKISILYKKKHLYMRPKIIVQESEEVKDSSKTKTATVKNFNLLSFGEEAEEDEDESVILNKKFSGKGKSAHDHLTGPKLSSQPAVEPFGLANK
ncbi:Peptidyl-prolyl isomerase cwc27 [Eufriesea mexicana]|uniref:Spliceosome-associated protein CWC27 homolog n=1 Tax=Eufriesea mexicana TaxID=516756 RepID=A0A310SA21_9HYME|nr:Peptidyl-prolyl isomerase cwc27 [Eufriesea mexicana]